MKRFISMAIVALSLSSVQAFAIGSGDEVIEVTAPNECCETPLPPSLATLTGWSPVGGGGAAVTLQQAATKSNKTKVQKARTKRATQTPAQQKSAGLWGKIIDLTLTVTGTLDLTIYDAEGNKRVELSTCKHATTNTDTSNNPCTQVKREQFVDPTDGVEKFVTTIALVKGVYKPQSWEADDKGWVAEVIDDQRIAIIHSTDAEFVFELNKALR